MTGLRHDSVGMFWQNLAEEKPAKADKIKMPRVLPPTPDTGWRPPTSFPNLSGADVLAVDVETKDPDLRERGPGVRRGAHIVGLAVGTGDARWYFPMRHEVGAEWNMDPDAVMAWARDTLACPMPKVGANLLYDADFLSAEGVTLAGEWWDVQIAEPLLDENRPSYSLDILGWQYLREGKRSSALSDWVEQAYRNNNYREEIWRTSPLLVGPYAEGDVELPMRILEKQVALLEEQELMDLWRIETGLLPMLLAMRQQGVRIDPVRRQVLDDRMTVELGTEQARLNKMAGGPINVNASTDLARLFDKIGEAYPRTPKTGAPSFTKGWLAQHPHEAAAAIVSVRRLMKLRDTFVRGYASLAINDRLHCMFHPLRTDENGAVSGRFASSNPNLQNIPVRDPLWGPLIRAMFIPEEGCEWIRHDWSQIEYRFLAHFGIGANAREVRRMYQTDPNTDFHEMVVGLTGLDRRSAKNVNFGLVYGMGVPLLASTLGLSRQEAEETVFSVYHERVPFVKDTYNHASSLATSRGYVRTILGRRARFDYWQPRDWNDTVENGTWEEDGSSAILGLGAARARWGEDMQLRRAFTHKALNRVLQGSSADLMKKAMLLMWKSGIYKVLAAPHLTVHDELDHSMQKGDPQAEEAIAEVKRIMETAISIRVPVIADEERGPSWGECK
jgi:DNA polymerase I-like protein with 3'-5' exonuclease and polymerase domains